MASEISGGDFTWGRVSTAAVRLQWGKGSRFSTSDPWLLSAAARLENRSLANIFRYSFWLHWKHHFLLEQTGPGLLCVMSGEA